MGKALSLGGLKTAALSGYKTERLKAAGYAILGSFVTSYVSGKAYMMLGGVLPKDGLIGKVAKVGTTLLTAGVVGYAAKKVVPSQANHVFLGGLISGTVEGLSEVFPNQIKAMGMKGDIADDMGLAWNLGDYADPRQISHPIHVNHQPLGDYADLRQMRAPVHVNHQPLGDFADPRQISHPVQVNQQPLGYAESMIGEEIEMSM